jgi:hypothetical protein
MHKCLSEGRLQPPEGQRFAGQMSNLGGVGAKGAAGLPLRGDDPRAQKHSSFWCEICKQDLESEKSLKQHLRGKKHSDRERKVKKVGSHVFLHFYNMRQHLACIGATHSLTLSQRDRESEAVMWFVYC